MFYLLRWIDCFRLLAADDNDDDDDVKKKSRCCSKKFENDRLRSLRERSSKRASNKQAQIVCFVRTLRIVST